MASELAKRAVRAGRALERIGWKARATGVVRAKAALPKDRARPLERIKKLVSIRKGEEDSIDDQIIPLEHNDGVEERDVMKGRGEVGTGKEGRRGREEVGGWGLVALSLSGAVLPTIP